MSEQRVYLVITKNGSVFEGQFDEAEAYKTARDIGGVVVAAPIVADCRDSA